jgi:hypothetical protein
MARFRARRSSEAIAAAETAGWRETKLLTQIASLDRSVASATIVAATHGSIAFPGVSAMPRRMAALGRRVVLGTRYQPPNFHHSDLWVASTGSRRSLFFVLVDVRELPPAAAPDMRVLAMRPFFVERNDANRRILPTIGLDFEVLLG